MISLLDMGLGLISNEMPLCGECSVRANGEGDKEESAKLALLLGVVVRLFLDFVVVLSFCYAWTQ